MTEKSHYHNNGMIEINPKIIMILYDMWKVLEMNANYIFNSL